MRSPALSGFLSLLLAASFCEGTAPGAQNLPNLRKGRLEIPFDPPVSFPKKAAARSQVRDEAAELAQLSAGIPERIDRVSHGQLPKELNRELKRIEKLAKHLRAEVAQ
jgi:hypothetical protein